MYTIGIYSDEAPVYHNFNSQEESQSFFDALPCELGSSDMGKMFEQNGTCYMAMWADQNVCVS